MTLIIFKTNWTFDRTQSAVGPHVQKCNLCKQGAALKKEEKLF
jgi:hypothetical protein